MTRDKHRACIYIDDETIEAINMIMEKYEVTQSAAFRVCVKIVRRELLDAKEEENRRGGARS